MGLINKVFFGISLSLVTSLCTFPVEAAIWQPAEDWVVVAYHDKHEILQAAEYHKEQAIKRLYEIEELIPKIKDWHLQDRIKTLTGAWISTSLIKNPRERLLTVGLAVLADVAVNELFDKGVSYLKMLRLFNIATSHFELSNYYNELSLKAPAGRKLKGRDCDVGLLFINNTIDHLTMIDMLATSLTYKEHGMVVSNYITQFRNQLIKEIIDHRKLTRSFREDMIAFEENFYEVVAEHSPDDRKIADWMREELRLAKDYLKRAEEEYGFKRKR